MRLGRIAAAVCTVTLAVALSACGSAEKTADKSTKTATTPAP